MLNLFKRVSVVFFILFSLSYVHLHAQRYSLDSIKKVLLTKLDDTTRLATIGYILENENQRDSISIHYNKEVIAIISKNLNKKEIDLKVKNKLLYYLAYWYADKAVVLSATKSNPEVITYLEKAITLFNYLKMQDEVWNCITNKGNTLLKLAEYDKAMVCFFEALKHHELKKNAFGIAASNASIGGVYLNQEKYNQAITFYKKSLSFFDTLKTPQNKDLYETAIINYNIGVCYLMLENYKEAKSFFYKALTIEKENNFIDNISHVYNRIGTIYIKEKEFDKALSAYNEGLKYAQKDRAKALLLNKIGEFYYLKKDNFKALSYFTNALIHVKLAKDLEILEDTYWHLYETYKDLKQFDKSLQIYELYTELKKSNNIEASKNALAQQQLKYDYEKKELETKLAQEKKISLINIENEKKNTRKNIFLYFLISLALMLGLSAFYIYKYFKQKNIITANKNNELKQKLLLTQMNPHFIFNSVDNIQSLIHNNQNKEAVNYLTKFSKLTRQILENSTLDYISLQEEITMLDNYLNIQQLLHNNKFNYTLTLEATTDPEMLLIPPMLTQPFVENAIKHGLKNKTSNGIINLRFYMITNQLFFEAIDNGGGIEPQTTHTNHKSMATSIVNERLNNNSLKKNIEITIETIYEGKNRIGAKTLFEIPYIYDN